MWLIITESRGSVKSTFEKDFCSTLCLTVGANIEFSPPALSEFIFDSKPSYCHTITTIVTNIASEREVTI